MPPRRANKVPKLAGIGPERWKVIVAEFDALQTEGWQEGRKTYIKDNRAEIDRFIAKHSAGSEHVVIQKVQSGPDLSEPIPKTRGWQVRHVDSSSILEIGPIHISGYRELKDRWRSLEVVDGRESGIAVDWRDRYPFLFAVDPELDWALFKHQAIPYGTHFPEWLSALVLNHVTGFHALIEKYEFPKHKEKRKKLKQLQMPKAVRDLLIPSNGAQCPDLLMFDPRDPSKWFFCDAKGPRDRIQDNQRTFWSKLVVGRKPVTVLWIQEAESLAGSTCEIALGLVVRNDELKNLKEQLASVIGKSC